MYHFCQKYCKLILEYKILHLRSQKLAGKLEIREAYVNGYSSCLIDVCVRACVCYKAIRIVSNRQKLIHKVARIKDVEK